MDMQHLITTLIISGVIGSIFSLISYFFKNIILKKIDEQGYELRTLKEELLRNYVTKEDFASNHRSHEELWKELNGTKERVARLEK